MNAAPPPATAVPPPWPAAAWHHLRLCRPDAPVIAFVSYLVGARLAGAALGSGEVLVATLLAVVTTNFIYSFNSVADWREDRISHPRRPIPSGKVSRRSAARYASVLLVASVLYPFVVARSGPSLLLFLLLPALGLAYSAPPIRLRRLPVAAVLVTCTGLLTPIVLGFLMHHGDLAARWPFFAALYAFCLGVVPLKTIDEVEEDAACGATNLYRRYGRGLLAVSALVLSADAAFAVVMLSGHARLFLLLVTAAALASVGAFAAGRLRASPYERIIHLVIAAGVLYFATLVAG